MSKNALGELIKNAREKKGMSQRELSRQSGIDNNTIAKLEKGERKKPNIFALKKIAYILHIDLEFLLTAAGYSKEDIEFELNTIANDVAFSAKDGKPVVLISEITQTKEEELITRKAICELIDSCNFEDLKIYKKSSSRDKKVISRGFEIYKNKTKLFEEGLKEKNQKNK